MVASVKAKIAPRKRKQMDFALALHRRIDTNTKELSKAHRFTAMQTICADGDAAGTRFKPALLQAKAPTAPHNNTTTHGLDRSRPRDDFAPNSKFLCSSQTISRLQARRVDFNRPSRSAKNLQCPYKAVTDALDEFFDIGKRLGQASTTAEFRAQTTPETMSFGLLGIDLPKSV